MEFTSEQISLIISGTLNALMIISRAIKTKDSTEAMGLLGKVIHKLFLSNNTNKKKPLDIWKGYEDKLEEAYWRYDTLKQTNPDRQSFKKVVRVLTNTEK